MEKVFHGARTVVQEHHEVSDMSRVEVTPLGTVQEGPDEAVAPQRHGPVEEAHPQEKANSQAC